MTMVRKFLSNNKKKRTSNNAAAFLPEPVWGEGRDPSIFDQSDVDHEGIMKIDYAIRLLQTHIAFVCAFVIDVPTNLEIVNDEFRDMDKRARAKHMLVLKRKAKQKKVEFGIDLHSLGPWISNNIFSNSAVLKVIMDFRNNVAIWGEIEPETRSFEIIKQLQEIRWSPSSEA